MRRRLSILVACCALFLLTGCEARTSVHVHVEANGSGTLSVSLKLDPEAAKTVPDIEQQLRVDDLTRAGWRVDGPKRTDDGRVSLLVRHEFATVDQANALMNQMGGPFRGFHLDRDASFAHVKTTFSGTVDLSQGVASFGDDVLGKRTGSPIGFDAAEASRSLGTDWARVLPVDVSVDLPGGGRESAPPVDDASQWHPQFGAASELRATSGGTNLLPLSLFIASAVLLTAALIVSVLWKSGKYRPQHRKSSGGVRARDLLAQSREGAE